MSDIGPSTSRPTRRAASNLAFINIIRPDEIRDRKVQTTIRQHVMKDIGKSRRKKPRVAVTTLEVRHAGPELLNSLPAAEDLVISRGTPQPPDTHGLDAQHVSDKAFRQLARLLNPIQLPVSDHARHIWHFIRIRVEQHQRSLSIVWIRMGLFDQAAFYLVLANAVRYMEYAKGRTASIGFYDNSESARYYSTSLGKLAQRLNDPVECKSVGVIAVILGCICHDVSVSKWDHYLVHMSGLQRIYHLRGSFEGLGNQIPEMACWLDVTGSAVFDTVPRFLLPREMSDTGFQGVKSPELDILMLNIQGPHPSLLPALRALEMLSAVAAIVNRQGDDPAFWQDDVRAIHILAPLAHYLLSMQRIQPGDSIALQSPELVVGEMARLACLMLLSGLKGRYPDFDTTDMTSLWSRLVAISSLNTECSGYLLDLQLWALITSGLLQEAVQRALLIPTTQRAYRRSGYTHAREVVSMVRHVAWINILEDANEKDILGEIEFHSTTGTKSDVGTGELRDADQIAVT